MSGIRSRWAAVGAAVAITLGAGGIGLVSATDPADAVTFVPITPCRLFDTRPDFQVGDRSAPLGPGDVHTVEATGNNGDCTGIPAGATAVSMNMTSTDASAPTFLTVWAAGETRPEASSMNPVPGAPAVPNGVISALNGDGEFSVYNLAGSVHVLADINGYYVDHDHDDRYYTESEVDAAIQNQKFVNINTMKDADNREANVPIGGPLGFDASLVVPPDYTGGDLTLVLNVMKLDFSPQVSCTVTLTSNYLYVMRPSTGASLTPAQLTGSGTVSLDAVFRDIDTLQLAITGQFEPGDSMTFGVFSDGSTCSSTDVGIHSAAVYYD